jgi:hypothetical protein
MTDEEREQSMRKENRRLYREAMADIREAVGLLRIALGEWASVDVFFCPSELQEIKKAFDVLKDYTA